jgi:ribonuclease Z
VCSGDVALQFDAGRSTTLRLTEAGLPPHGLTALLLAHVHSDHVVDVPDVVITRWIQAQLHPCGPLTVVAPEGPTARFVRGMLGLYADDIALRTAHVGTAPPEVGLRTFTPTAEPTVVWTSSDLAVTVRAVAVHHGPVADAVGYRVDTPDGAVVVSGDTRVCDEIERLCAGADVLVHEACRTTPLRNLIAGTVFERIFSYHADTVELGAMAQRSGLPHVVLTHLIPPPIDPGNADAFAQVLRDGGYTGRITVGTDLDTSDVTATAGPST